MEPAALAKFLLNTLYALIYPGFLLPKFINISTMPETITYKE